MARRVYDVAMEAKRVGDHYYLAPESDDEYEVLRQAIGQRLMKASGMDRDETVALSTHQSRSLVKFLLEGREGLVRHGIHAANLPVYISCLEDMPLSPELARNIALDLKIASCILTIPDGLPENFT